MIAEAVIFAKPTTKKRKSAMTNYNKNQPDSIKKMFGSIAKQYDQTNAILSFQMHRWWNRQLVNMMPSDMKALADLCCGTGEIAQGYLKKHQNSKKAYLIDFCPEMLSCARLKNIEASKHEIEYITADVQEIPLQDHSVDAATVAYGIRNVKDPGKFIGEVYRILQPGGSFGILELTRPKNPVLRAGHEFYLRNLLPILGKIATSNKGAYEYLCSSIENFTKPEDIENIMKQKGFVEIKRKPLMGGIATIIVGKR
jgi:demethylmenaquinone methyltransferase/2-methoxy-6-polyprenyl-1,4-benzoquinol methylase